MAKKLFIAIFLFVKSPAFAEVRCPTTGFSGEPKPKLIVQTKGGYKLLVCGGEDKTQAFKPFRMITEFDIYSVSADGKVSAALKSASATKFYLVKADRDRLILQELWLYRGKFRPSFETTISCDVAGCTLSNEVCIFKFEKPKTEKAIDVFNLYIEGPKRGKVPSEGEVLALSDLALSGNERARDIFLNKPPTLTLDGSSGEAFKDSAEWIKKFLDKNCGK